jgi:hypothetical protein
MARFASHEGVLMELILILILLVVGIAVWVRSQAGPQSQHHGFIPMPENAQTVTNDRTASLPDSEVPRDATDITNFGRSFSIALRHGVVEGWSAAGMRSRHALSTLSSRAAIHFAIAWGLAAVCVALASGLVTTPVPWLPPPGLFWYIAAVGVPFSYFLLALAANTPRRDELTVADDATIDAIVRTLIHRHFEVNRERYVMERTRLLETALKEARNSALVEGREAGYDIAHREMDKAVKVAAAEAYERGRQAGEADKERAADQAFERGFVLAKS